MLVPIWGNAVGLLIMVFWFGVALVYSTEIGRVIDHGYFYAITWKSTDILIRVFYTRARIKKLDVPKEINGAKNADSMWLLSALGPTLYTPIWIIGAITGAGTYALNNFV